MTQGAAGAGVPSAAIISVGDELLFGQTLNSNGAWLGERLHHLGFEVSARFVVRDLEEDILAVVVRSARDFDLTLVTGGLGPTPDDLTRDAVAKGLGLKLSVDEHILARLEARSRRLGLERPAAGMEQMAQVPEGATVVPNPHGAAPGLAMLHGGSVVVLLPGIPREMREIFDSGVIDLLARRFQGDLRPAFHRTFHTSGIPESRLAEIIGGRLPPDISPVSLAYLPHVGGVRLRLTARGVRNPEEAEALLDGVQRYLDPILRSYGYEAESGELSEAVGRALSATGLTLAVAESCTGGLVAKGLTDHPGSSAYFLGGIVAYEDSVKTSLLGVSRELLEKGGAVSEGVATAMARGVARALGANAGIGITGVAGPGGGTDEKPVGTVCYAAFLDGEDVVKTTRFLGDREDVRNRAAAAALLLLHGLLEERSR